MNSNYIPKSRQDSLTDAIITFLLILIAVIALYPLWFVLIASISDPSEIARGNVLVLPKSVGFSAYESLLRYRRIWVGYRNSIFYLFAGSFLMLAVTLPAAFALSRPRLKGRKIINAIFILTMYFGGGLIPTYLLHNKLGWINTIWVMIIPPSLNVYYMILARTSFQSIPEELFESAALDGAGEARFFSQFALPLSKATIAVLFLFSALGWWNDYVRFMIYIENPDIQSLQVVIREITQKVTSSLTEGMSMDEIFQLERDRELMKYSVVVIAALPFCLLYPFIQKYFNKGVMLGALKG